MSPLAAPGPRPPPQPPPSETDGYTPQRDEERDWHQEHIEQMTDEHNRSHSHRKRLTYEQQLERLHNGRVCFDGRALNEKLTSPFSNNMPDVDQIFTRLGKFKVLSHIDLKKGYHQCRIHPPDQDKTSFRVRGKVYKWIGAPFGLAHLTHHFQALMEKVLSDHSDYCMVFVDDIFVFSDSIDEHAAHCASILETLTRWNLKVNAAKCKFGFTTLKVLGHIITAGGTIHVDPDKLQKLATFDRPRTGKAMERYLGFVNYIVQYLPFAHRFTLPLNGLKKLKQIPDSAWLPEHEQCFRTINAALQSKIVLQKPLPDVMLQVAVDASQYGVGAILFQDMMGPDSKLHRRYIDMASMSLNKYQRNYSAPKRELLAILFGIRRFHHHLFGRKFHVWTDHRALIYLFSQTSPSYMLQDWLASILEYSFTVAHTPGAENIVPDGLSRLYEPLNPPPTGLNPSTTTTATRAVTTRQQSRPSKRLAPVLPRRKTATRSDSDNSSPGSPSRPNDDPSTDDALPSGNDHPVDATDETEEDSLPRPAANPYPPERTSLIVQELLKYPEKELQTFIQERLEKILPPIAQRATILQDAHNQGHFGADHIFKRLFQDSNLFWPGMKRDISHHIAQCLPCLRYNVGKSGFHPLRPRNVHEVLQCWAIDLAELPTSNAGFNYTLVMVDMASGFTILLPLRDKQMTTLGKELYKIFGLFGFPREIQSDNGSEFVNQVMNAVQAVAQIKSRLSAPWNPRCNGMAENRVKTAKSILYKTVANNFTEWETFLPAIQLSMNTKELQRTGTCPFTLVFNRSSPLINCQDPITGEPTPMSAKEILARSQRIREIVHPELFSKSEREKRAMASRFDDHHRIKPNHRLTPGAGVMLKNNMRASKSDPRWNGPYSIFEITKSGGARLAHLDGTSYGAPVPVDQLKLIRKDFWKSLEDTYDIEDILDHRLRSDGSQMEYLLKWKDHPDAANSWEPEENILAQDMLKAYWKAVRAADLAHPIRGKFANKKRSRFDLKATAAVEALNHNRQPSQVPMSSNLHPRKQQRTPTIPPHNVLQPQRRRAISDPDLTDDDAIAWIPRNKRSRLS